MTTLLTEVFCFCFGHVSKLIADIFQDNLLPFENPCNFQLTSNLAPRKYSKRCIVGRTRLSLINLQDPTMKQQFFFLLFLIATAAVAQRAPIKFGGVPIVDLKLVPISVNFIIK